MSLVLNGDTPPARTSRRTPTPRRRLCEVCRSNHPNKMACAKFKVIFGKTAKYVCVDDLGPGLSKRTPGEHYIVEVLLT